MVGDAPTKSIFLLWERLISSDFATRLSSIMKSAQASTALYASCVVLAAATPLRRYFDSSNELSSSSTRPVGPTLTASTRPCPSIFADADVVSELKSSDETDFTVEFYEAGDMRKFYDESFPVGYLEDFDYSTSMREDARLEGIENPDRILAVLSSYYTRVVHPIRMFPGGFSALANREVIAAAAQRRTHPALEVTFERIHTSQLRNPTILCSPGGQFSPDGVVFAGEPTVDDRRPIMCITEPLTKWDMDKVNPEFKAKQDYLALDLYCSNEAAIFHQVSSCPCLLVCIAHERIVVKGAVFGDRIISYLLQPGMTSLNPTLLSFFSNDEGVFLIATFIRAFLGGSPSTSSRTYKTKASAVTVDDGDDGPPSAACEDVFIGPHLDTFEMDGKRVKLRYTGHVRDEPKTAAFTAVVQVHWNADIKQDVVALFTPNAAPDMHGLLMDKSVARGTPRIWFCEWVESAASFVVVMESIAVVTESAAGYTAGLHLTLSDFARLRETAGKEKASDIVLGKSANSYVLARGEDKAPLLVDFDTSTLSLRTASEGNQCSRPEL
ncbi:hypothetical protein C8Q70DRAFT_932144 [Cubamyces menziesii]|nr:hypothetical protein C8Q70DRAFT_932144 [Cubamyces menziesii]